MAKEDMAEVEVTKEDTEGRNQSEQLEMENPLSRPLMGKAERRSQRFSSAGILCLPHRIIRKFCGVRKIRANFVKCLVVVRNIC